MSDVWSAAPVPGAAGGFREDPVEGGPPLPSPDGHWWWDGHRWTPLVHRESMAQAG